MALRLCCMAVRLCCMAVGLCYMALGLCYMAVGLCCMAVRLCCMAVGRVGTDQDMASGPQGSVPYIVNNFYCLYSLPPETYIVLSLQRNALPIILN